MFSPAVLASLICVPTSPYSGPNISRVPVLYVINYSADNHLAKPEFLARLRTGPPDLFHAGKDGPFTHNWGAIAGWGGENVHTGGKEKESYLRRLSPRELDEKFEACRHYTEAMHGAGIKMLYHYVGGMTIGGNPESDARSGFWEFYDHWGEYGRFGLGPKPPEDPLDWTMRNADDSTCFIYARDYESYLPGTRWAVCMNNPYWRQWMGAVFRASASVGFDGIFVDNSFCRCYCRTCRAGFADFVKREARPTTEMATAADGGRAWFDTQEFWIDTIARWLHDMRAEARTVNPDFGVFPNFGTHPGYQRLAAACDYVMGEGDFWEFGARGFGHIRFHKDPGMLRTPLVGGLALKRFQDMVVSYRYTAAEGGRPAPVWLTHGHQARSEAATELRLCEAMAFGAGACTFARGSLPPEVYARYRRFLVTRRHLYEELMPFCRVGLAYFPRQAFHGNMHHVDQVWALADALNATHVPYRVVTEQDCRAGELGDLSILFLPAVEHIETVEAQALRAFTRRGGTLVCHDGVPAQDEYYRPLASEFRLEPGTGSQAAGKVVVLRGDVVSAAVANQCATALGAPAGIVADGNGADLAGLRFELRVSPDAKRLVLHLLNYSIPLETGDERLDELREIALRLPCPSGWKGAQAVLHASDSDEAQGIAVSLPRGSWVDVTVPKLRLYSILEVTGQ